MPPRLNRMPEPDPENRKMLRTFSEELSDRNPSDVLSRGLATKVVVDREHEKKMAALRDQWNMFLIEGREMAVQSVTSEETFLLEQSRKLYASWAKFCKRLPENQRQDISKDVPSLNRLRDSVKEASESWQNQRKGTLSGRLKEKFSGLCKTMENHSAILSIIPTNDKYIRLLTGSLSAIAQASVNHADIADGVADSLQELSQDMVFWNSVIQEHGHTDAIIRCIMELYVVVFEFLTEIFNHWSRSSWKRLATSLNEGSFDKLFGEKRARMQAIERKMLRLANLEFQKTVRRRVDQMQVNFETMMENQESAGQAQRNMLFDVGSKVQLLLDQSVRPSLEDRPAQGLLLEADEEEFMSSDGSTNLGTQPSKVHAQPPRIVEEHSHPSFDMRTNPELDRNHRFQREKVLQHLRLIAERYGDDIKRVTDIMSKATRIAVKPRVRQRIADWTSSDRSETLWIQGPHGGHELSQNTLTAVCLLALSNQSEIPCLSYFCTLSTADQSSISEASPRKTLSDLVLSLITQIVLLVPDQLLISNDLSPDRFERLMKDGKDVGFNQALQIMHDLRSLLPPYLHCIIDGLQFVEDRDDSPHTKNLQRVLEALISTPGIEPKGPQNTLLESSNDTPEVKVRRVVKVCFTTNGYVDALARLGEDLEVGKIGCHDDSDLPWIEEGQQLMPHWSDETQ